jgi:predicted RNase H-like nuclease (RuvC/YqgF family)
VRQAAMNRVKELERQRKELDTELEFYAKDPSKVPPSLQRLVDENAKSMEVQQRFIADQEAEMGRVNRRFDEELVRLQQLWAQIAAPSN